MVPSARGLFSVEEGREGGALPYDTGQPCIVTGPRPGHSGHRPGSVQNQYVWQKKHMLIVFACKLLHLAVHCTFSKYYVVS